jgi:hypothetical protein
MSNEANTATQNKQRIYGSNIDIFLCLLTEKISKARIRNVMNELALTEIQNLPRKRAAISQHVNEACGNDTINVQN